MHEGVNHMWRWEIKDYGGGNKKAQKLSRKRKG